MSKSRRLELLEKIQGHRNSYVMSYVLSNRPNDEGRLTHDAVRQMYTLLGELKPIEKEKALDLFICGLDGDHDVPWQMVAMIREVFKNFNVIVPYKAHGAVTMLALGADTIVMSEKGELSPIPAAVSALDVLGGKESGVAESVSVEDVKALIALMEGLGRVREKQRIDAFLRVIDKVPPLLLGNINKSLEQTKTVCLKLLESRRKPFGSGANMKIVKKLLSGFLSPHHAILRTEAVKRFGLKQVKRDEAIDPLAWELFTLYEDEFKGSEPFHPDEIMERSEEEEKVFSNHKLVYIETTKRTKVFQHDVKMKKLRQHPPQMQFNPQITLPPFHIPADLPVNHQSILDYIQQWLQGHLPHVIEECFAKWSYSLPVQAFERMDLNRKWVDE
jgi:hypothetical protein